MGVLSASLAPSLSCTRLCRVHQVLAPLQHQSLLLTSTHASPPACRTLHPPELIRHLCMCCVLKVGMDAAAAVTLAEQCLTAEALRDIDISYNPDLGAASDKAAAALLKLMGHKGLTVLRAQCCRLGWQAGKALIGDALTRTGTVKVGLLTAPAPI